MIEIKLQVKDGITPSLRRITSDLRRNIKAFIEEAKSEVNADLMPHIYENCHDLADLAAMGHPFAKDRYGMHPEPDDIHYQSGAMLRSFNDEMEFIDTPEQYRLTMGFDENKDSEGYDHAKFVQDAGADSKMYPRPALLMSTDRLRPRLINLFYKHMANTVTMNRI